MTKFCVVIIPRTVSVLVAAIVLLSCSSSPEQADSRQGKDAVEQSDLFSVKDLFSTPEGRAALELPPDLLTSSNEKVQANANADANDESTTQVLPKVVGATIRTDQNRSWLEIDAEADVVWQKLSEFWAFQRIELSDYQPKAGVMETDWFAKTGNNAGGVSGVSAEWLKGFIAQRTSLDKFTIRLQRGETNRTKLFVTHRSRERIAKEARSNNKTTEFHWVEREQDAEKVAQLLQTIVLLFGGKQDANEVSTDDKEPT